jgi:tRNA threonylcarbamoyladenosine biosynthesis protein TsaE
LIQYSYSLDEIDSVTQKLIDLAGEVKIWVFKGEMGAGKTTLIKSLAKAFDIIDQVSSPTFGIVNHYENPRQEEFFHFDFYRIDNPMEAFDIGIEEYFYSGNYCWLEWAERIGSFLPEQFFLIEIITDSPKQRTLNLQHINDGN